MKEKQLYCRLQFKHAQKFMIQDPSWIPHPLDLEIRSVLNPNFLSCIYFKQEQGRTIFEPLYMMLGINGKLIGLMAEKVEKRHMLLG